MSTLCLAAEQDIERYLVFNLRLLYGNLLKLAQPLCRPTNGLVGIFAVPCAATLDKGSAEFMLCTTSPANGMSSIQFTGCPKTLAYACIAARDAQASSASMLHDSLLPGPPHCYSRQESVICFYAECVCPRLAEGAAGARWAHVVDMICSWRRLTACIQGVHLFNAIVEACVSPRVDLSEELCSLFHKH